MDYTTKYEQWIKKAIADPDLSTELMSVKESDGEIEDRFYRDLEFGTGGLRGIIGAGTNRINVYVVAKSTQGYSHYLKKNFNEPNVAIAYDSRIKSRLFAETAAGVFAANGIKTYIFPQLMPTPTLSFAVRHLNCCGGIVITASHNPPQYNGYKIYGPDGSQITTQVAADILNDINKVDTFISVCNLPFNEGLDKGLIEYIDEETVTAYINTVSIESLLDSKTNKDVYITYSPLNGTGISCVPRCLEQNGFAKISIPEVQKEPDGNFTTCPYPNPEIKETLAVAIGYAKEIGAELVLATDPDCDRVGAAIKVKDDYVLINGNQMGVLLLDFICQMRIKKGTMPKQPLAVKTIVTTEMAESVASNYGVEIINTLTGFKFIGEQIGYLEARGEQDRYIFGFEESYGYLSSTAIRDKDAVNASLLICEMFAWYKSYDMTLVDALDKLYNEFGFYTEKLLSFDFEGALGFDKMQALMTTLREASPTEVAGIRVEKIEDFTRDGTGLPKSNVLKYKLSGGATVLVRPSGTEPKLKIYLSAKGENWVDSNASIRDLEAYFRGWIDEY